MLKTPLVLWLLITQSITALSCSAFLWESEEGSFLGKSYDWHHDNAFLMTNLKGVKKTGFTIKPWEAGPEWVSKFGSVTFNQYGREFPNGGMNEAGLVVEVLWLNESQYEPLDRRPVLNQLTWVQYQLDNFASIGEVVEGLSQYRMSPIQGKIHYFLCDQTSNCAVIEWLKGKPVVHSGSDLKVKAITNNSVEESQKRIDGGNGLSNRSDSVVDSSSISRYLEVASVIQSEKASLENTFKVLDSVQIPQRTTWQITYDMANRKIVYRTRKNPTLRSVDLKSIKLDCSVPNMMLDIHEGTNEVGNYFSQYDAQKNYELLQDSLSDVNGAWALIPFLQRYPALTYCVND